MTQPFDIEAAGFGDFIRALREVGYFPVDLNALISAHRTLRAMAKSEAGNAVSTIILDGPPGVGKSYMAQSISKMLASAYLQYNCHPDSSSEELIRDINIEAPVLAQSGFATQAFTKEDLYIYGPIYDAIRRSQTEKVVLLIDEIDKARPAVDALLLGFLNDGYISVQGLDDNNGVKKLACNPANLLVVITKNDERDLHPALLRRGRVVYMDYPPAEVEAQILKEIAGIGQEAATSLITQANKLRKNSNITKPPSPPELVRLALDFKDVLDKDVHEETKADGSKKLLCGVPRDVLNKNFYNGMLAKYEEQSLGRKLVKDKSAGTALLHAMLRDKGGSGSIRFIETQALRRGK